MRTLIFLFLLIFGNSSDSVISKLQEKFESIDFIAADFSQISEQNNSLNGKFYFAKENKYRIELPNNLIISDGTTIWNNDIKRNKVIISSMEEDPLAFSLHQYIYEYPSMCEVTEEKVVDGFLLFLDAEGTELNFKSAKLWINFNYMIEKVLVVDYAGNLFKLQFSNISTPESLNQSLFEYNVKDEKVIDLR